MFRFTLILTGLAASILGALAAGTTLHWLSVPSYSNAIVLFLWLTHTIIYVMVARQLKLSPPGDFVKLYLGITVLRILFFGAFVFLIIRLDPPGAYQNAVLFLLSYFLFTGAEVVALYRVVSSQNPLTKGRKEA